MKIVIKTLLAIVLTTLAMSARLRGKPGPTPKAADLGDHFGTEPVKNLYGPKAPIAIVNLMREGITGRDTPITPITNFYKEVNPLQVVNGGLDNTSYDASKIIKPMIAGIFYFQYFIFFYKNSANFIFSLRHLKCLFTIFNFVLIYFV